MAQLVRIDYTPPSSLDDEVHLKDKKQSASTPTPRYNRTTASTKISIMCAREMGMLGAADRYLNAFCESSKIGFGETLHGLFAGETQTARAPVEPSLEIDEITVIEFLFSRPQFAFASP